MDDLFDSDVETFGKVFRSLKRLESEHLSRQLSLICAGMNGTKESIIQMQRSFDIWSSDNGKQICRDTAKGLEALNRKRK